MFWSKVPPGDRTILKQCVIAAANGPFFDDYVFPSLFSQDRDALRSAANNIQAANELTASACSAITASLSNLLGYPHNKAASLSDWVSATSLEINQLSDRWFSLLPPIKYESLTVHGPSKHEDKFYRVIEFAASPVHGYCSQVWTGTNWASNTNGPGCPQIMKAPTASRDQLLAASVDISDLPDGYDPLCTGHE